MKLSSDVCNRCRLVCVKFCLNRISFAVVIEKCLGGSLFWDTLYIALSSQVTMQQRNGAANTLKQLRGVKQMSFKFVSENSQ